MTVGFTEEDSSTQVCFELVVTSKLSFTWSIIRPRLGYELILDYWCLIMKLFSFRTKA